MITIKEKVIALPGNIVQVCNYRRSNQWETGELRTVSIGVNSKGSTHVSYHVWVARTPKHARGKYGYYLYVGKTGIRL